MKYKPGDKVRIKSLDWYNSNKDEIGRVMCDYIGFCKEMTKYCGAVLTIMTIGNQDIGSKQKYFMHETDYAWGFTDDMIEGLADEVVPQDKMISLNDACEWMKNTIDDDVFINCGAIVKFMTANEFVEYFRKTMEE
jgi:hypothetical protein